MKLKGVTTPMKALNEYFVMVVFTLLLNTVHVFAIFVFTIFDVIFEQRDMVVKGKVCYKRDGR